MRFTSEERDTLDSAIVDVLREHGASVTYVIRNRIRMIGRKPIETSDVLRACDRLARSGKIAEAPSPYAVMKMWSWQRGDLSLDRPRDS